ncbi:Bacterial extracellular solute-binding proteins, family 3 [Grimontia celer]|uniref:Bacterial extracellular solute-binding proteins, family 3 n=1 Tax=Grimontia celer TaxID=1796497 RepID=A0A128F4R0_9GAMM|nr:transporter substrate-binding domain-containing protein [Grimontia celer]CZF81374.1 Bacterial extracellular solute-binding proteins, family 3 [Grimontia celer]
MRKTLTTVLLAAFTLLGSSAYARISGDNHFIIGVQAFEDYSPYSRYQNQSYQGFNRDLLDAFAREYNYSFEYQALPLKRLYSAFLRGEVDLKYPDNPNWSASRKEGHDILYSDSVVSFVDGVVTLDDTQILSEDSLKRLGLISGFTPWPFMDKVKSKEISLFEVKEMESLIRLLSSKRIDGIYTNVAALNVKLKDSEQNLPSMSLNKNLPYLSGSRHLSSIKRPDVVIQFNRFLSMQGELINKLKNQHGLQEAEEILGSPQ